MFYLRVFYDRVCRLVSTVSLTSVLRALLYYVSTSILYLFQNETFQKKLLKAFPKSHAHLNCRKVVRNGDKKLQYNLPNLLNDFFFE